MDLGKYIDSQLTEIRSISAKCEAKIEEIKKKQSSGWTEMYGVPIHLSTEQIAANEPTVREAIGKIMEERDKEIEKIIQETEEKLAEEKKRAIQACAAAEPVPTDEQLRRVEQLKTEYGVGESMILAKFIEDMDFHVTNGTVYAYSYYLLARTVMQKTPESERKLQEIYIKLFPSIPERAAELKSVEDYINVFRSNIILFKFSVASPVQSQEEQIARIRMKRELAELGAINQLPQ